MTEPPHSICGPAVPASLDLVHSLLAEVWASHDDVQPEDRMRFELGVTEIAGNIVEHAAAPAPIDFHLGVEVFDDRLEARFRDPGRRVEIDFDRATMPDAMAESGRGLALVLAVVDELTYRHDGSDNHWLVVRRRTPA
ncbi:ATP-binding protein [Modestobacter versicolor]|uniref:Serine/threonine-protein kinase RsbW n=1 Tax=Modestobacter versicolor TaxID=429133 RepID=A0A839Y4I6_9ACTN|nr:ATP-binding protein [Modestobacter versicolor]MBB3677655.1 serine/threonine-protein kinase RsbW [Modestobacter versicolor]